MSKSALIAFSVAIVFCLGGCKEEQVAESRASTYKYAAQLEALPSCQAQVKSKEPGVVMLRTEDGRMLRIGGPDAGPEVQQFVKTLKFATTYALPEAFMEHQQRLAKPPQTAKATARLPSASYEYAAQLLAMPSCSATVEKLGGCSVNLVTAGGGKRLHLGGPGAGPEVARFIRTLEVGKAYFLPDAFMDFQKLEEKKPNKAKASAGF